MPGASPQGESEGSSPPSEPPKQEGSRATGPRGGGRTTRPRAQTVSEGKQPDPSGSMRPGASIRVLRGSYEGLELPLDRNWMVIGRGRSADIVIADPTISRAHAVIGCDAEGFFVKDMGSTNGTRVNGARSSQARLADRDEVLLGKLLLQVSLPGAGSEK